MTSTFTPTTDSTTTPTFHPTLNTSPTGYIDDLGSQDLDKIDAEMNRLASIKEKAINQKVAVEMTKLTTEESDLLRQLNAVRDRIKIVKKGYGKSTSSTSSTSSTTKRHKGKGFSGMDPKPIILKSLKATGSRMTEVVAAVKEAINYDGSDPSLNASVGGLLVSMSKAGEITKLGHGLYAPIQPSIEPSTSV